MIAYLNGEFIPLKEARVSALDRGFLYGDGVFETLRAYSGRVFRLDAHLNRLKKGLQILSILCPEEEHLKEAIMGVLTKNSLQNAYLRLNVSRGLCQRGPLPRDCGQPTLFCYAEPFDGMPEDLYQRGVALGLSRRPQWRLPEEAHLKALSFLPNILSRISAADVFDTILLSPEGYISETTISNIFFIKDNTLYTPSIDCGPLLGITRQVVLEIASDEGIAVQEGKFEMSELLAADEVFITNTLVEILPATKILDRVIGVGPITRKLHTAYREKVLQETSEPDLCK